MGPQYSNKDLKDKIEPRKLLIPTTDICQQTGHITYESNFIIDETKQAEFEKLPEQIKKFWKELQVHQMHEIQTRIQQEMLDGMDRR